MLEWTVRAPVDRDRHAGPEQAQGLCRARRVEVFAAPKRRPPAPDRDEREVEVRDQAIHALKERCIAREVDPARSADRVTEGGSAHTAERGTPFVVLRMGSSHFDGSHRKRFSLIDLDHAVEAESSDEATQPAWHDCCRRAVEAAERRNVQMVTMGV
jgi:hypothetical protein